MTTAMSSNKNRAMFLSELGSIWLPAIADLDARLRRNPPARIADIGCGVGWSSIRLARAYPKVRVDGFDLDKAAIEKAWANARQERLTDRLTFHTRDVGDGVLNGRYDLVAAFDRIHHISHPVNVLATMHRLAGQKGIVIVVDEIISDDLRRYALAAGFREVETVPVVHDLFQLYRLHRS